MIQITKFEIYKLNFQNILIRIANANCPVPILSREYTEKKP